MQPNQQFPGNYPPQGGGMPMPPQMPQQMPPAGYPGGPVQGQPFPMPPGSGQQMPPQGFPGGPPPMMPPGQGMPLGPGMPGMMPGPQYPQPGMPAQHGMPTMQHGVPMHGPGGPQQLPPPPSNPNSTQNTLQIAEIRDGIVIMNDGSYRAVAMVKSINFDLMSPQERESVEYAYQGFLNSLYFPVQIFIRSQKVDIRPYIQKLDKIRSEHDNMLLALLMEDYIDFMSDLAYQTNIMNKKFYMVIPFYPVIDIGKTAKAGKNAMNGIFGKKEERVIINEPDLEKAKSELRNRVQQVLSGLMQTGVQGLPLDTQELIELYYDYYNPETAPRQQLKNFDDLTAPIVTKGQGQAAQPNLDREMF